MSLNPQHEPTMTPGEFRGYLDECITQWRNARDEQDDKMAQYYIDAFQSVRTTYFDEPLPPIEVGDKDSPYTWKEQAAMDTICQAMHLIQTLDERGRLKVNQEELAQAVHGLQQFVIQHMLHRHWPDDFGDWYAQDKSDG